MKAQVIVAFLLSLTSSIANAQFESSKPIVCDNTEKIIRSLIEVYDEKVVWSAVNPQDSTRFSLFVNSKTGAWTLLQMTPRVACILGVGEESTMVNDDTI